MGNLAVGDVLTIHGEKVKVQDVDPDTMEVTLKDHTRFGVQQVQDGQVLYVEHLAPAHPEDHEDGDAEEPDFVATKGAPNQPRDARGRYSGGDPVGQTGDWKSLGRPSAEELEPIARPARMGRTAAMEKLATPYVKEDPIGNSIGFGSRLKEHLDEHITEGDHARPGFLPHMEAAVENPAEIWEDNPPEGPRLRHIAAFTAENGTRSFAVVSHRLGETRATIVTGTPKTHQSINKLRTGKLVYVRPKA